MANKTTLSLVALLCLTSSVMYLSSCKKEKKEEPVVVKEKSKIVFSGTVVTMESKERKPVPSAAVDVNGQQAKVGEKGDFKIEVDSTGRYIVSVRAEGFGLVSKVFTASVTEKVYKLTPSDIKSFDATKPIVMRDTRALTSCTGSDLKNINWSAQPFRSVPLVFDATGRLTDFGMSGELQTAFQLLSTTAVCNPGISISIPAASLIGSGGEQATDVTVALTTVDLYSEDGMPGDYSFRSQDGKQQGYMRSMGAGMVEIYSKDRKVKFTKMKENAKATITIPVDPVQLKLTKKIPATIPFLTYNEEEGIWVHDGEAKLNKERNAYVAETNHFSAFNMDIEKTVPACIRYRVGSTMPNPYTVAALDYDGETLKPSFPHVVNEPGATPCNEVSGKSENMLYRLPNSSKTVCIVMYDNGSPATPYGLEIVETGANYDPSTSVPPCPYTPWNCYPTTADPYNFSYIDKALIMAVKVLPGGNITIRWIGNRDPGSSHTYELWKCDVDGNDVGASPIQTVSGVAASDNPRNPNAAKTINSTLTTLTLVSGDFIKIKATTYPGSPSSNAVSIL